MMKLIFYVPAILFTLLYGVAALKSIGDLSPIVIVWLVMFYSSGVLLHKKNIWGSVLGVMPALHFMYLGTQNTGQIINEMPIGIILFLYYIVCGIVVYQRKKRSKP